MSRIPLSRDAIVLTVFALAFTFLTVSSYTQKSATWDEPQHLTTGYIALKHHDYRLDPEHPPFLRMWAALPLLVMRDVHLDSGSIPDELDMSWTLHNQFVFCHSFLYLQNDADRLLYSARFMIVLLGILLGILLFSWARELFGFWPAVVVLGLYSTEPNILTHASLVTTDFGVTCFFFGATYFLWRASRSITAGNLAGLTVFFALAQVSKFTSLLLGPVVLALLAVQVGTNRPWTLRLGRPREIATRAQKAAAGLAIILLLFVASFVAVWAVYGFRHAPSVGTVQSGRFQSLDLSRERTPLLTTVVSWLDDHRLLPNAYSQGFLLGQAKAQERSTYLAGQFNVKGWWYYFPVAFLIKTPLALFLMFLAGVALMIRGWKDSLVDSLFVLIPIVVYLGMAMVSSLNIGLRHILPIYPFVLLLAGRTAAEFLSAKERILSIALAVLCAAQLMELVRVYPHYLAFFSQCVGGPSHGHEYLIDSNLDWGQDLKPLKQWMDKNNVQHINLSYFGTADPAYYGINCTHLPGAPFFAADSVNLPQLPGYVAISVTNLRGLYLNDMGKAFYQPLLDRKPDAVIGYSIHVYWVDHPWW